MVVAMDDFFVHTLMALVRNLAASTSSKRLAWFSLSSDPGKRCGWALKQHFKLEFLRAPHAVYRRGMVMPELHAARTPSTRDPDYTLILEHIRHCRLIYNAGYRDV